MYKGDLLFQKLLKYNFDLCRNKPDVPSYLKKHFECYIQDIEEAVSGHNPFLGSEFVSQVLGYIPLIQDYCNELVRIGRTYRDGQVKNAFDIAYDLFALIKPYYLPGFSWNERYGVYYRIRQGDFRIRPSEDSKMKKAELFHIKNEKRNLIGAYRFSIPGFPCLYLTSGLELGWFESGMPKQFSYCKMRIMESGENALRLIDLSNRPIDLLSNIYVWLLKARKDILEQEKIYQYLLNYIITYPLAASCSVKVKSRSDKFVEEYVIPQMFLHWIREDEKYDGVKYKSSLNTTLVQGMGVVNIALPVKKFREDGLCEFLTSKISVSDISYLDVNEDFIKYKKWLQDITEFKNQLWVKMIRDDYRGDYLLRLIDICENINVTYSSIINGNHLNDIVLHQIECLADYVYTIQENKNNIINNNVTKAKSYHSTIDENELKETASIDLDTFYKLVTKGLHKHVVFNFSTESPDNFEKI